MDRHSYTLLPPPYANGHEHARNGIQYKVDIAIVGSGPGGGAAAKVLSQSGLRILVLEAGPRYSRFRNNYAHTARFHMQENGAMLAQGNAIFPIAAGKGVGGSTLINSALSFRAPNSVLDKWAALLKDEGWSARHLLPLYDEISQYIGVSITPENIAGENNKLIVRGIHALGYDGGFAPRSTPKCVGCGVCYYGCPSGGKGSSNLNFLAEAVQNGVTIQAETQIEQVHTVQNRISRISGYAIDPDTNQKSGLVEVEADMFIFSAGAIGTPKLIWHSGLVSIMGEHVGEGLQIHPGSTLLGIADHDINMWKGATQGAYYHPPGLEGVLPHTFSASPEVCLLAAGFVGSRFQEGLRLLSKMCGMLVMVSDKGHGRVRAKKDGSADIRYDFHPADVQRIKDGLVSVARVLIAGGAKNLRAPIHSVGVFQTPEELERHLKPLKIQDFSLYAAHPMGTCRMGTDPQTSVIDPTGKAHRVENLYIADASVFPSSLGVNPQLSTMVCSTKIAQNILRTL
ncbi:MAG: GMC family oxidoreductase [Myxococcota bacterium]|nr:GMC family oxidoreductase [Myxococcota bacterium]